MLDTTELPEGTGEFLDTWLFLLERLVNPRTILESQHTFPAKTAQNNFQTFNPLKFLIYIQKVKCIIHMMILLFLDNVHIAFELIKIYDMI